MLPGRLPCEERLELLALGIGPCRLLWAAGTSAKKHLPAMGTMQSMSLAQAMRKWARPTSLRCPRAHQKVQLRQRRVRERLGAAGKWCGVNARMELQGSRF